jgi:hypothetical protein
MHGLRRAFVPLALLFSTLLSSREANAGIQIGDSFSGTFSIDPTTPLFSGSSSTLYDYELPSAPGSLPPALGTFALVINGQKFSAPVIVVEDFLATNGSWAWFLEAAAPNNASMDILLAGASKSTSILPLDLNSYLLKQLSVIS